MSDVLIGRLLVDMAANTARLQGDMREAQRIVGAAGREMQAAANLARTALGSLVAGLSVGGLVASFRAITNGLDDLNDVADRTGSTIERISQLEGAIAPFGHSINTVADASIKLVRQMQGAAEESAKATSAFQALKVNALDPVTGNLRDQFDVLTDVAKALNGYADGSNKLAIVQALFGKQGAELLPLLKDLANARETEARVTTKQAEEAERFNQALATLQYESKSAARDLAGPLTSALANLLEQFNAARRAGLGLGSTLASLPIGPNRTGNIFASAVAELWNGPASVGTMNQSVMRQTAAELERLRARRSQLELEQVARRQGGYVTGGGGRPELYDKDIAELEKRLQFLREEEQRRVLRASSGPGSMDARDLRLYGPQMLDQAPRLPDLDAAKKSAETAAKEAEKYRELDLKGWVAYAEAILKEAEETDTALAKIYDERNKAAEKSDLERLAAVEAQAAARTKWVTDLDEEIRRQREANEEYGRTASQLEALRVARLDETLAIRQRTLALEESIAGDSETVQIMREEIARLKELKELRGESARGMRVSEELKAQKEEADALAKSIDSLGLKFESAGENALVNFQKTRDVVNGLIADIARLGIRETLTKPGAALLTQGLKSLGNWAVGQFGTTAPVVSNGWVSAEGGSTIPNALGNAFDGSGIVSSPTLFRFAKGTGLMGEAGPEAIMPLRRGPDGRLGVAAAGAGAGIGSLSITIAPGTAQTVRNEVLNMFPTIRDLAVSAVYDELARRGTVPA